MAFQAGAFQTAFQQSGAVIQVPIDTPRSRTVICQENQPREISRGFTRRVTVAPFTRRVVR